MLENFDPNKWTSPFQLILEIFAGVMAFIGFKKYKVSDAGDKTVIASESANAAQFTALQESITAMKEAHEKDMAQVKADNTALRAELAQVRSEQAIQHQTINKQQIRLTRLQVLAIRLIGLVEQSGTIIPSPVQAEIEELVEDEKATHDLH